MRPTEWVASRVSDPMRRRYARNSLLIRIHLEDKLARREQCPMSRRSHEKIPPPEPDELFDEWVRYCFESGFDAANGDADEDPRFETIEPVLLARRLNRLFLKPAFLAERFSDVDLARAIWFIFGIDSEYMRIARDPAVPIQLQQQWVSSLKCFYRDLLDRVCNNGGRRPDEDMYDSGRHDRPGFTDLDGAVYMIWDMDGVGWLAGEAHLVDPIFGVLESTLDLRCSTCVISGLHGLNHLQDDHPDRVSGIVSRFLARRRGMPDWMRSYAECAARGECQ